MNHILVTGAAGLFGNFQIMPFDLNRLVKTAERKIIRMPETVRGFRIVFADCIGRRVAVVTGRGGVVARFQPTAVLLFHNMAVGARSRVVAHIRIAFRIDERIKTDTDRQAECRADNHEFDDLQAHL